MDEFNPSGTAAAHTRAEAMNRGIGSVKANPLARPLAGVRRVADAQDKLLSNQCFSGSRPTYWPAGLIYG